MKTQTTTEWLDKMVAVCGPDECWNAKPSGYNKRGWHVAFKAGGKRHMAHRAAWERANGAIPDGLFVLHRCDNPKCCNPRHLFLGTQSQNAADMWAKGRARPAPRRAPQGPSSQRRLDTPEVLCLFAMFSSGQTQKRIAEHFGMTDVAVGCVLRGKTYPEFIEQRKQISHLLGRGTKKRMTFQAAPQFAEGECAAIHP